MTRRGVSDWSAELRRSGRVCVDVSRVRSVLDVVTGAGMTLIGVVAVVYGSTGWRVVAAVFLALALWLLVWSLMIALRLGSWRSPQVVVDAAGLTVRHGYLHVPWADLVGATASTTRYRGVPVNRWVAVAIAADRYDTWLRARPPVVRLLGRRRGRRAGTLNLPANLRVDAEAFAAWLVDEIAERRRAERARLRGQP